MAFARLHHPLPSVPPSLGLAPATRRIVLQRIPNRPRLQLCDSRAAFCAMAPLHSTPALPVPNPPPGSLSTFYSLLPPTLAVAVAIAQLFSEYWETKKTLDMKETKLRAEEEDFDFKPTENRTLNGFHAELSDRAKAVGSQKHPVFDNVGISYLVVIACTSLACWLCCQCQPFMNVVAKHREIFYTIHACFVVLYPCLKEFIQSLQENRKIGLERREMVLTIKKFGAGAQ